MNAPLKICVVGGTRYFGALMVRGLVADGHRVTIVTRGLAPDDHGDSVVRITADATSANSLDAALEGHEFDVVIHQLIYTPVDAQAAIHAFGARAGRLVMTSTIEVYAESEGGHPGGHSEASFKPEDHDIDPNLPWNDPAFVEAHYALGKRQAETTLALGAPFPVTVVRVGHVLGAHEFTGRLEWFASRVRSGIPVADGPVSTFVSATDLADFFVWLVRNPIDGHVNAGSQPPLAPGDIIEAVRRFIDVTPGIGEAHASPFQYPASFTMSTDRVSHAGYTFQNSHEWLERVVEEHLA